MTGAQMVLCYGPKHSHQNAKNIRAWFDANPDISRDVRAGYVRAWQKSGYLTKPHADELLV